MYSFAGQTEDIKKTSDSTRQDMNSASEFHRQLKCHKNSGESSEQFEPGGILVEGGIISVQGNSVWKASLQLVQHIFASNWSICGVPGG